jgi:hypothetical protein
MQPFPILLCLACFFPPLAFPVLQPDDLLLISIRFFEVPLLALRLPLPRIVSHCFFPGSIPVTRAVQPLQPGDPLLSLPVCRSCPSRARAWWEKPWIWPPNLHDWRQAIACILILMAHLRSHSRICGLKTPLGCLITSRPSRTHPSLEASAMILFSTPSPHRMTFFCRSIRVTHPRFMSRFTLSLVYPAHP